MSDHGVSTDERILSSAIRLMEQKGYKSVTIKDIAQDAEVSEMTIFRHFETKKGVLEAAIQKYSYVLPMRKLFEEKIKWNLELDPRPAQLVSAH